MRRPVFRALFEDELVIDNFAGGGGATEGIQKALARPVDIAINHDPIAIAMHRANHPETKHYCENILEVDPREVCGGRRVGMVWFSPDCTHFSKAKGTQPRKKEIRGLAWVVIDWAEKVRPRVMMLENVEEFQTWGPLLENGRPDPEKLGETFREWLAKLSDLGYAFEYKLLVAADFGTPTTRKRLFLIARCDGRPIVWPTATHGPGRPIEWRPASEIIDWSLPCPSIFLSRAEGREAGVNRPLADATLQRIATGIQRYVIEESAPFVIPLTHQGDKRVHRIGEPLRTVTGAHRGELALVEPFVVRHGHYSHKTGAGLRRGKGMPGIFKHLVCPIITKHYTGVVGNDVLRTLGTVTTRDHHALTAAFITKYYGTSTGSSLRSPLPTVTAGGKKGGGHLAAVRAFLVKYYSAGGKSSQQQSLFDPLHTVPTKDRFGLVVVRGEPYVIVDIGMRMLQPRELFSAQGFSESYKIRPDYKGKPLTKTAQIALAGNSVCPQVAEAMVLANAA